jgi:DNA-binding transcriptional MerR regulator
MEQEFYSLGEAALMLQCQPHRIMYLFSTRAVPEPLRVGGRRLFSLQDIAAIAEKMKQQVAAQWEREGRTHE